jgi:uncharacterized phage protein gp47/JayE
MTMGLQIKVHEQILQAVINHIVANTDLSDITDVSEFKTELAAVCRQLDEAYFQLSLLPDLFNLDKCFGDDLDRRALEIQPVAISRRLAKKTTGTVVFGRSGSVGEVSIPAGTKVKTTTGVEFVTTADGVILNGQTASAEVPIIAVLSGTSGNVEEESIIRFGSKPSGVETVINPGTFTNGRDKESDPEFRARIKEYLANLSGSTLRALAFFAKQVELPSGQRVVYAKAVEDAIERGEVYLYIDDGSGTAESFDTNAENLCEGLAGPPTDSAVGGEVRLFTDVKPLVPNMPLTVISDDRGTLTNGAEFTVNEANGQFNFDPPLATGEQVTADYTYFTGLIAEVQKVIDGDENDETNYPGIRAGGTRVTVLAPTVLQQVIDISLTIADGFDTTATRNAVKAAVTAYVNGQGISGDILRNDLIERIMGVDGVYNCTLNTPAADVLLLDDQLPRVTASNVTVT